MSSVPPFIGSLYSEETGLFDRTIISDVSLRTTGLKIKENGFDLDIDFKEVDEDILNEDYHTHVVVGLSINLIIQSATGTNQLLSSSIVWNKSKNHLTLSVNVKVNSNLVILKYYVLPIDQFLVLLNSTTQNNVNQNISQEAELFLNLLKKFINSLVNIRKMEHFMAKVDVENINKFYQICFNKKEEFIQEIHNNLFHLNIDNWFVKLSNFTNILVQQVELVKEFKRDFDMIQSETRERVILAKTLINDGILYFNTKNSVLDEFNSLQAKNKYYYVIVFCKQFSSENEQKWEETFFQFKRLFNENKNLAGYKFGVVDLDVCPNIPFEKPNETCIYVIHNGRIVSDNVSEEQSATKLNLIQNNDFEISPNQPGNISLLNISCPACKTDNTKRDWTCCKCNSFVEYGHDNFVYCSCGRAPIKDARFKCSDSKHGGQFKNGDVKQLLSTVDKLEKTEELNILILGQAGVGKSTWVNAIVNYLTYNTIDEAKNNMIVSIPAKFIVTDNEYKPIEIKIGEDENEVLTDGASSTQNCRTYRVPYHDKIINLIDTPGICDVRGIEKDKENLKNILSHISQVDVLHGICILLKPNNAKLDVIFKFCVKELLTNLHKSAAKNLIFCFTNSRATSYKPGDTMPALKVLLNDIEVKIETDKNRVYCLDNEAFRFLCTCGHPRIDYTTTEIKSYNDSWTKSVTETKRLFDFISQLKPHQVKDTATLNNARLIIASLTKPIADITHTIEINIAAINEKKSLIEKFVTTEKELEKTMNVPHIKLVSVKLGYPRTVCTSSSCVKHYSLGNTNFQDTEFITHCHEHCYLSNVVPETHPNVLLKQCAAMDSTGLQCQHCKCSWEAHMHIDFEQVREEEELIDSEMKKELKAKNLLKEKKQVIIDKGEERIKALINEKNKILEIGAKFALFLQKSAITPYNDALDDYLKFLIQIETNKPNKSNIDQSVIEQMKNTRKAYKAQVEIFKKAASVTSGDLKITPEDIRKWRQSLYGLPISGPQLEQIMNLVFEAQERYKYNTKCSVKKIDRNKSKKPGFFSW